MKTYQNPIKKCGDFADPFVLRFNGRYYLYCTNPDIRCWSSQDLVEWRPEGPVISEDEFPGLVPFAPEVVYWNGTFYMYTSPHGRGHYVLRSDKPTGPFRKITDNIGHNIDMSIFIDDDGRWYAYWADERGIMGCEMASPAAFGKECMVGAYMHGWTEGPFVMKHNGTYHLTYTGNHYLSKGYRIHTAVSNSPLGPFRDSAHNPAVVKTTGSVVGLGHSSTVTGPDLQTHYIVYHNLNPDHTRDLNIDPILFTESDAYVVGPTNTKRPAPRTADYQDLFDSAPGDEWVVTHGAWTVKDGRRVSQGKFFCRCEHRLPESGTAELHFAAGSDQTTRYGAFFQGEDRLLRIEIDRAHDRIIAGNGDAVEFTVALPRGYRHEALHQLRIQFGQRTTPFLDGVRLPEIESPVGGALFGYCSDNSIVMGSAAFSRMAADIPLCPIPCILPPQEHYFIQTDHGGNYAFSLVGACGNGPALAVDGKLTETFVSKTDRVVSTFDLPLDESVHDIQIVDKELRFARLLIYERFPAAEEQISVRGFGPYEKQCGERVFCDLEIHADVEIGESSDNGQAGILFRAGALADGGEGADKILGTDFFVGYRVTLESGRVCLWRHRYDETLLAERRDAAARRNTVIVTAVGSCISVRINGEEVISYCDHEPILWGGVGFHARRCQIDGILAAREIPPQGS